MGESIVCVHLLDDYSGSAKVFAAAIAVLSEAGHRTTVLVGSHGSPGFIRSRHAVETVPYRFLSRKIPLLMEFLLVQWRLYRRVRHALRAEGATAVYVSTVLPVGAILAGRVSRRPVVTHLHEVGLGTRALFTVLLASAVRFSTRLVAVSNYVAQELSLPADRTRTIHNSLDPAEWDRVCTIAGRRRPPMRDEPFEVLMLCSLKWYKGVGTFVDLARACRTSDSPVLRRAHFKLILNCEQAEFDVFLQEASLGGPAPMVQAIRRPASVYDHYASAHLVLNLSLPEGWVETFGLTLLEAMACGIPVVSPVIGGCTELFEDGDGGWRIDARDTAALMQRIEILGSQPAAWQAASAQAIRAARRFSPAAFSARVTALFEAS
jgi:glycosyltransferase involved in cell wall biosynthesis